MNSGEYTDRLLDCLEQNNAKATFFMQGQNVEGYQDTVKRMMEIGCELGSHSYDHTNLYNLDADGVAKQFKDTDAALIEACGQPASVARALMETGRKRSSMRQGSHFSCGRWIQRTGSF